MTSKLNAVGSGTGPQNNTHKRKRRRKARTQDFSSSSSDSDSDSEDAQVEGTERQEESQEDSDEQSEQHINFPSHSEDEGYDSTNDRDKVDNQETVLPQDRYKLDSQPPPVFPASLTNLDDPDANKEFARYISDLQLKEFGSDLDALRNAKDFNERSLQSLIDILNQGESLFNREEKELMLTIDQ